MIARILATVAAVALLTAAGQTLEPRHHATIGGTPVPELHCAEDEAIQFTGPDELDCIHIEDLAR